MTAFRIEPFEINGTTYQPGEPVLVRSRRDGITFADYGFFNGTVDVGLGVGIVIDVEGDDVVILASELVEILSTAQPTEIAR